jgi:hypothetical protein
MNGAWAELALVSLAIGVGLLAVRGRVAGLGRPTDPPQHRAGGGAAMSDTVTIPLREQVAQAVHRHVNPLDRADAALAVVRNAVAALPTTGPVRDAVLDLLDGGTR